jgi:hypothetical protein
MRLSLRILLAVKFHNFTKMEKEGWMQHGVEVSSVRAQMKA